MNNISLTHIKYDKLDDIRGDTLKDDTLKVIGDMILRGWPNELLVHKAFIIRDGQIVIPVCLRESMKRKVHMGHLGRNSCLRRARDVIYWPSMSTDIREYVENVVYVLHIKTYNNQNHYMCMKLQNTLAKCWN